MSSIRVKTKYYTEGVYGSTEEKTLYCVHNNTSDYVTYYDEDGEIILVVPDTIAYNILDAINKLYVPKQGNKLKFDVEYMNKDDIKKIL